MRKIILIGGGVVVLALAILLGLQFLRTDGLPSTDAQAPTAPSSGDYQRDVRDIMRPVIQGDTVSVEMARQAREKLLAVRVPADYKDMHLHLVIALTEVQEGSGERGRQRLEAAKTAYPWLTQ